MIGKVWIFITAFSFITYVHHVRSACMPNDIKTHLDDLLLEEHMFEIKVFSSEIKVKGNNEHELLSVINALCSTWTKNKKKEKDKLIVLQTFELMLFFFLDKFESFCANLNCTNAYTVTRVNTTVFGDMYRRSCNGSISDLKCPSKGTTISPNITAAEKSTTFFTTVDSITTAHKSTTSLTTVSPNITFPENLDLSTVSSASTETNNAQNLNLRSTIKTCSGVLVVSLLLNIILFMLVLKKNKPTAEQANSHGGVRLLMNRQQIESPC